MGTILKYMRLVVEAALALVLTVALIYPNSLTEMLGDWVGKVQLLPLAASFAVGWFALWIAVTLVFGRVYCSSVCPMGALQDLFARLRGLAGIKDYHYHPVGNSLRYAVLAVVGVLILLGVTIVLIVADPYTAYKEMVLHLSRPVQGSLLGLLASVVALIAVAVVSVLRGRLICNTVCPVGTTLGVVSRYSIFHIDIDTDMCTQCRKCEYVCKAECIDLIDHVVDSSRCVECFDCLTVCDNDAIHYTTTRKQLSIPMMRRAGGEVCSTATDGSLMETAETNTVVKDSDN